MAPWRRRTRNIRVGGRWRHGDACGGGRVRPNLASRMEFLTVGEAHQVVQAPEPDFESGREGVRAAHGVALTAVLSANHYQESW
jgi:hypothetical protein